MDEMMLNGEERALLPLTVVASPFFCHTSSFTGWATTTQEEKHTSIGTRNKHDVVASHCDGFCVDWRQRRCVIEECQLEKGLI
jgi:hypothetical protein